MVNTNCNNNIEAPVIHRDGPPEIPRTRKDVVPERVYSFENPPEPIPASDIKETKSAEVLVVGGGLAGMSAAIAAREAGAKTILIEKTNTFATF
jgi:fumarate reductase flavoprotein subunit